MKRVLSVLILCVLALGLFSGCAAVSGEAALVESVASITGAGYIGLADSFAGKVVSGRSADVKKDADKTVLEVLVAEGDTVQEGDILFSYDTEALQLSLDRLVIDKEGLENAISAAESEIAELKTQKKSAAASQQLSYTLQIDARNADIREAEYNLALKEREITAMETAMEHTDITAPISGRVMSVKDDDADLSGGVMGGDMGGGGSDAFITIMDVSSYRVEGRINELNRGMLTEGMPVTVRSRTDETQVWYGVIEQIDWENPVQNSQQGYYGGGNDEMTTASKYPFYVALDDIDGLFLGQHVYIEPAAEVSDEPAGLMLPSYYVCDAEGSPWVWAASADDKLEKRPVIIGMYDPELDCYEILSGLDITDYIAFPDEETLSEGMAVTRYQEHSYSSDDGGGAAFIPGGVVYYEYGIG